MQTLTHVLSGVALAMVMAPEPLAAGCLVTASIAPDKLDAILAGGSAKIWGKIHRGPTHNPWYWLLGLALAYFFLYGFMASGATKMHLVHLLPWFFLGGMLHVALDALTPMGIPYLPMSRKRFSLKLIRTGHFFDYILGMALFAGACFYFFKMGRFSELFDVLTFPPI